jgi:polyisoprenyl-phosphate glycosyltransferase
MPAEKGTQPSAPFSKTDPSLRERVALSVVAPCYNEQLSLQAFVDRMIAACERLGETYEIVVVNDGSHDRTWELIQALVARHPTIVGVNLARNHGHQLAVSAGLTLAQGSRVLVIDSDLQDPPEVLPQMWSKMNEGFDVVYGKRTTRPNETAFKLATAYWFYRILRILAEVEIPTDTGDFRLMSRRIVDRLVSMPERDRFIRGMVAWLGGRQAAVMYERASRHAGETQYTLRKMARLAVNGILGFSTAPLKLASILALLGAATGIGLGLITLATYFHGGTVTGWTSQAMITVFFGVGQFLCLAILGAYVGRLYEQNKGRPLYLIDEVVSKSALESETLGKSDHVVTDRDVA